jgi:hypothetical protein
MVVGSYVEDRLTDRFAPGGRGRIGKVVSFQVDADGWASAMVNFGKFVDGVGVSELFPIHIIEPSTPVGGASHQVEGQPK